MKVEYWYDPDCEMGRVMIDGVVVEEGNYWDFHPEHFLDGMERMAEALKADVEFVKIETVYNDDGSWERK